MASGPSLKETDLDVKARRGILSPPSISSGHFGALFLSVYSFRLINTTFKIHKSAVQLLHCMGKISRSELTVNIFSICSSSNILETLNTLEKFVIFRLMPAVSNH